MMDFIRHHLIPVLMFGAAAILLIVLTFYSATRPDEDEDEDDEDGELGSTMKMSGSHAADTQEIPEAHARKSRMLALKDSLDKSLQTRAGVRASDLDRLAMPWFMLVGTEGSGKKSLLASTGLPLPFGPPVEVDSVRKDAGRWWLFEQAVVVEAPTAKAAPKAVAPSEVTAAEPALHVDVSEGWNNLLGLLRRERPDSPLNGIIITVSCADLVGTRRKTPEEISEQAELIRAFLEKTRRVLDVRLPVHLLITRCDILPGFRSFAETLPDARRDDIFGWANPAPLEKMFDPAAADAGFTVLRKSLEDLHDELLAAPEKVHDADGLFVFVSEFAEIQDPLRDFVAKLFPAGERRPSLFFRGVYFTGDASEFAAKAASQAEEESATLHISMEATEAESHSLVFLRMLFADKIFKEAGLARSAAKLRISRDIRVVVAQAAAVVIALLGGVGLWTAVNGIHAGSKVVRSGLRTQSGDLTRVLAGVAIDFDALKRDAHPSGKDSVASRQEADASVISLVSELRGVSSDRMRSAFIPSSWFSPIPKTIDKSIIDGVQTLLLPVARQRLQERADQLLGTDAHPGLSGADDLDPTDAKSLVTYLADVRRLSRNIARYNSLASADSGTVSDLSGLVDYLFGERPFDSTATSPEFERALKTATARRLDVTPAQTSAVVARAVGLVATISDSATRELSSKGTAPRIDADLEALRRLNALSELADPKTGLVSTVTDSSVIGLKEAKAVQDSITARLGLVGVRVLKDTLTPDQAGLRLGGMLKELFATKLLDPVEGSSVSDDLRPGQSLRWDIGELELAFALRGAFKRANIMAADAFPAPTYTRLRAAFESQMRGRAIDLVASAERFTPDSLGGQAEMRAATENLSAASTRIIHMAALMDTLKASSEGKRLIAIGARQAEHVLGLADAIADSAKYLAPHPTVVQAWRGTIPIGFAALGVADSGAFTLKLEREQIPPMQNLAALVGPALDYLKLPQVGASMVTNPKLSAEWKGIAAAAGTEATTTSLAALHGFIANTMGPIDIVSCQTAAARLDSVIPQVDWFIMRRRQFRAAMVGRCGKAGSADAIAAYDKLRALFTAKLAGHFPFVDSSKAAAAPDADPAAVREFYGLYDAFAKSGEVALRSDARVGPGARAAFTFLDQVAGARAFFAPFVDSAVARKAPEYAFVVDPPKAKTGTDAPAPRELHTGARMVAIDDSTRDGIWGFGEPVKITLANGAADPKGFVASGWWGLIELGMLQHDVKIRIFHPDTKVELRLPIFPQVAPAIPAPPRGR